MCAHDQCFCTALLALLVKTPNFLITEPASLVLYTHRPTFLSFFKRHAKCSNYHIFADQPFPLTERPTVCTKQDQSQAASRLDTSLTDEPTRQNTDKQTHNRPTALLCH